MATIIRSDLTIPGTYKLTENTQVAPGVKITVLPKGLSELMTLQGGVVTGHTVTSRASGTSPTSSARKWPAPRPRPQL